MAYRFAPLGLATLLAAPAVLAAPVVNVVTVVSTQVAYATVGPNDAVQVQNNGGSPPPPPAAAAATSQATTSSSAPAVLASSGHAGHGSSSAAASSATGGAQPSSSGTPTSGGSGASGAKMGLVYPKSPSNAAAASQIASSNSGKIGWVSDWEGYADGALPSGVEFVATFQSQFSSDWAQPQKDQGPQGQATSCIFENEPDDGAVSDATSAWATYISGASGCKAGGLGGPAIKNTGNSWLQQFYGTVDKSKVSFQPVHYYLDSADMASDETIQNAANNMGAMLEPIYKTAGVKLWVTEFGGCPYFLGSGQRNSACPEYKTEQYASAIKYMAAALDNLDYVVKYSPYQVNAAGGPGQITPSGDGQQLLNAYLNH